MFREALTAALGRVASTASAANWCRLKPRQRWVLDRSRRSLSRFTADTAEQEQLHNFIDRFQLELNTLGSEITSTWFTPGRT